MRRVSLPPTLSIRPWFGRGRGGAQLLFLDAAISTLVSVWLFVALTSSSVRLFDHKIDEKKPD